METHKFYVSGMHCKACVLMTECELEESPSVTSAKTNLATETVVVTGEFDGLEPEIIAAELSKPLAKHGYALSVEKPPPKQKRWDELLYALPLAAALILAFAALQRAGLIQIIKGNNVPFVTPFLVGIVASLSSCLAVVGGVVLSLSATFARGGNATRPLIMFHSARIVSFFLLGGVLGALGSAFRLGSTATLIVQIAIAAVMLLLGINLLDLFPGTKKLQPSMPKFLSSRVIETSRLTNALVPMLVGILTFFLPCGYTQSMQLYALSTGSFLTGGLTMLAFAIGTFPVLALVSAGSVRMTSSANRGIFFKAAGILVIAFAAFNAYYALVAAGIVS